MRQTEPLIPPPKPGGRPRATDIHEVFNAISYLLRSGCAWRMLPHEFPPWQTVYHYFRQWRKDGTWERIHEVLRGQVRDRVGRAREPSAAKKTKGRRRHVLVGTLGLILAVGVHAADVQDWDGAKLVLNRVKHLLARLRLGWADGGYAGQLLDWAQQMCG